MNLNYDEGIEHMQKLCDEAPNKIPYSNSFKIGDFTIEYSGSKHDGLKNDVIVKSIGK